MATEKPQRITLDKNELKAFNQRMRTRGALGEQDYRFIDAMTEAVEAISQAVGNNKVNGKNEWLRITRVPAPRQCRGL